MALLRSDGLMSRGALVAIVLSLVAVFVLVLGSIKKADAQAPCKPKRVMVYLIEKGVTDAQAKAFTRQFANTSIYWPDGPPPFTVTRTPGVNIETIETKTLPFLRIRYPDSPILFLYGKSQLQEYRSYLYAKYGGLVTDAQGNTDMQKGYSLAPAWQWTDAHHELLHGAKCLHHQNSFDDPATWTRDANADHYPWCMCKK